jgi:uncharacterized protein (TIGR00661 family)
VNIVIGVSGFGNGHSARQADVVQALLKRGHRLVLFGFLNSAKYFKAHFPAIPLFPLHVPIIHVSASGIEFGKTATEPANVYDDGNRLNFQAMQLAVDTFGCKPDLIITDYELVAAQFAYATDTPLVTLDQHSKYAGFQFPDVNGYSRHEDRSRLGMFFPCADLRLACSFFEISWRKDPRFDVHVIPPILRQELRELQPATDKATHEILVYFSPHGTTPQPLAEIYAVFTQLPEKQFIVYTRKPQADFANIAFRLFDTTSFFTTLASAEAVITTAGHNFLSELVYLQKPVYAIPYGSFDQQCCADAIQHNEVGIGSEQISVQSLAQFFENLPIYRHNLSTGYGLTKAFNGIEVVLAELNRHFGV